MWCLSHFPAVVSLLNIGLLECIISSSFEFLKCRLIRLNQQRPLVAPYVSIKNKCDFTVSLQLQIFFYNKTYRRIKLVICLESNHF